MGEQEIIMELRLIVEDLREMPSAEKEAGEVLTLIRDLVTHRKSSVEVLRLAQDIKLHARVRAQQSL